MLQLRLNHQIADSITRNRFNEMREAGILTDMKLSIGLVFFNCHKIVMSGASPFLREVIKTTSSSGSNAVVVALNAEHLPYMDHLMKFLYLGVLVIDLESFYGFCKLADTLAIKFLVDGVQNKNATASNSSLPPSTRQNYERKYHSQVKITSAGAATGPQKKLKKTPKIKERTKNNEKKQKKQVVSNRNAALSTKKNTTGEMARRLKNKALHFLTSYQESPSAFKHIARRKMRLMKNGSSANNPKVADRKNCIKALPAVDQGQNPGPVAAVRPRRKAYRAAELNMKVVIAHLKRPVRKEQED